MIAKHVVSLTQIINFNMGVVYHPTAGPLKDRVQFAAGDPANGVGSIEIINVKESDTGTYQCKVKKLPGSKNKKMLLTVYSKSYHRLIGYH